jgi:hypothetical protein
MPADNPAKPDPAPANTAERENIAKIVLWTAIGGLIALSAVSVWHDPGSATNIFNSLLPVFGTWVGTLLAFYFTKDNFEAATKSVTTMAGKFSGISDVLKQIPAKDKMRQLKDMEIYPFKAGGEGDCVLSTLLGQVKSDRVLMFTDGRIGYLAYKATIHQFLTKLALNQVAAGGKNVQNVTLADAFAADPSLKKIFQKSFGFVAETATLADAQREMERVSKDYACNDIFVTPTGKPDEVVTGWITDNTIAENLKV